MIGFFIPVPPQPLNSDIILLRSLQGNEAFWFVCWFPRQSLGNTTAIVFTFTWIKCFCLLESSLCNKVCTRCGNRRGEEPNRALGKLSIISREALMCHIWEKAMGAKRGHLKEYNSIIRVPVTGNSDTAWTNRCHIQGWCGTNSAPVALTHSSPVWGETCCSHFTHKQTEARNFPKSWG